jgi:DNA (cytosine-5)-methyltransferase 1
VSALRIGSLCTGYGGLDVAVQAVFGGELAWVADPDPGAAAILAHHHPNTPNLGDITTVRWQDVAQVDIVCGGYPCQPFSDAGQRRGVEDERHIWPHFATAIRVLRPRIVVLENVRGHLGRGFDTVLADLAGLGFDAEWRTVRASEVGAPHRRERLFVVATSRDASLRGWHAQSATEGSGQRSGATGRPNRDAPADTPGDGRDARRPAAARLVGRPDAALGGGATPADADRDGCARVAELHSKTEAGIEEQRRDDADGCVLAWGAYEPAIRRWEAILGRPAPRPTEPGANGQPRLTSTFTEWLMGLPAGHVTDVPGLSRNQQLKALGNGVVPQQATAALVHLTERRAAA